MASPNKLLEKKYYKLIKDTSKKNGWKFKEYFIYKKDDFFFYYTMFWIHPKNNIITGTLEFKPLNIDKLYWKVASYEEDLFKLPLSYSVSGSTIVFGTKYYDFKFTELNDNIILELLDTIEQKVSEIKATLSSKANYLNFATQEKLRQQDYLTTLLYFEEKEKLIAYIADCEKNNISSGISWMSGENYYDKIKQFIDSEA